MAWVDFMRLRRYADGVRTLGWINLAVTMVLGVTFTASAHDFSTLGLAASWVSAVMAITHCIAWMIDRRSNQVVGR